MKINVLTPYRKGGPYKWGGDLVRELNRNHITARHVHRIPELLASPFFRDCDIIHTAVPLPFNLWRKPIILTVHGDYRREKNIWKKFYPLAIKRADYVTVPSEFLKRELGIERAVVIPNGVETAPYPENRPFDLNHLKFVTVTNFNFEGKAKGVEILIGILEKLRQRMNIRFSFTIAGDGRLLEKIKKRHADKPNVHFLGFSEDVGGILSGADLFLYYSFQDSFGIAVLEAMARGLPVVVNDYGAIREIITPDREGLVCGNEDDFLSALERFVGHPDEFLSQRRRAFEKAKNTFSWERISGLYKKYYESVSPRGRVSGVEG